MSTAPPLSSERRRVRRSGPAERRPKWRHPQAGRFIFIAMLAITLLYVGLCFRQVRQASQVYADLATSNQRADVRYMLGRPVNVLGEAGAWQPARSAPRAAQAPGWGYQLQTGGRLQVAFEPSGDTVASISCEDEAMVATSCPEVLGLTMGTSEDRIWYVLGEPSRQHYAGDVKLLSYDDLGLTFGLKRFMLYKVTLARGSGGLGFVPRAIRYMVP